MQERSIGVAFVAGCLTLLLSAAWLCPAAQAATPPPCNDVSWLNPPFPPPLLTDVDQAPGTGDCQFQEFASWNFMALVLGNSPLFESWPTDEQVFPASGKPICSGAALGSALSPIIQQTGAGLVQALAKLRKTDALSGPPAQATGQPLVDRNGRYVQYETRLNPVLCQAISSCQLYDQTCVLAAQKAKPAFTWPSGNTQTIGAAELKLSWRVLETCNLPDSPKPCVPDNLALYFWIGNVTVDSYSPKIQGSVPGVTLGLVGFHLIQKTPSRPEFVWATWEHTANDPVCPGSDNSVCQDPSRANGGVATPSHWSFFDSNVNPAPLLNQPPQCPDASVGGTPTQANCLNSPYYNQATPQTQPKTEVCRLFPCGGGDQSEIADLNEAIRGKLAGNVWWNYFLEGTVWGNSTAAPTGPSDSAGSIYLANTTMETYFQNQIFNCFTCHNSAPGGGYKPSDGGFVNLDFVHALIAAQQVSPSCSVNFNTCLQTTSPAKLMPSR